MGGTYSRFFKTGATVNLNINRSEWNLPILPGSKEQNKTTWYEKGRLGEEAIAAVEIVHSWNKDTRQFAGDIKVTFEEAPTGDEIAVALYIVEDSIVGGPRYDQYTDYWYHGNYPELEEWGAEIEADSVHFAGGHWIEGYPHKWSFRESILNGDFWGLTDVIPANAEVGTEYKVPFTYTMPSEYHDLAVIDKNVYLVAIVAYKDVEVINCDDAYLVADATTIAEQLSGVSVSNSALSVAGNQLELSVSHEGLYDISIHGMNGQEIFSQNVRCVSGVNSIALDNAAVSRGAYVVSVSQGGKQLFSTKTLLK